MVYGKKGRTRFKGFSLIEILIALAVLAIGILGVYAAFAWGSSSSAYGAEVSEATSHARQLMEIVRSQNLAFQDAPNLPGAGTGLNDAASVRAPLNQTPHGSFGTLPGGTRYTRNIRVQRVSNVVSDYRYNLFLVTVAVYWERQGVEKSVVLTSYARNASS